MGETKKHCLQASDATRDAERCGHRGCLRDTPEGAQAAEHSAGRGQSSRCCAPELLGPHHTPVRAEAWRALTAPEPLQVAHDAAVLPTILSRTRQALELGEVLGSPANCLIAGFKTSL